MDAAPEGEVLVGVRAIGTEVTLDQIQTSGLYQMPIEVSVTTMESPQPGGRGGRGAVAGASPQPVTVQHTYTIDLKQQHQVFTFPLDREPINFGLDPQAWVMMQATIEKR